jgi:hypothetical protein
MPYYFNINISPGNSNLHFEQCHYSRASCRLNLLLNKASKFISSLAKQHNYHFDLNHEIFLGVDDAKRLYKDHVAI